MAKTIDATKEDREKHRSLTEMMGLVDLDIVKHESDDEEKKITLICVPRWGVGVCPDCGKAVVENHDYPSQRHIHDTPARGYQVELVFDVHRLKAHVAFKVKPMSGTSNACRNSAVIAWRS